MAMAASASRKRHRDHDALAGRQAIGLDHDRRALLAHISQRVSSIGEAVIGAGWNVELGAERLCESLGAFELGGGLAWAERLDAGGREIVDDPRHQRRLRPDHDEVHLVGLAEIDHSRMVGDVEGDAFGLVGDTGIARRAPQFRQQGRSGDLPRQGVFAAAGTEQEDVHL